MSRVHFIPCSFKISPALKQALRDEARRLDTTESELVRHILSVDLKVDNVPSRWGGSRKPKDDCHA